MRVERFELELQSLIARIERGELDHKADTSPTKGWDRAHQQRFVDTILRGWHVPEIHVAVAEPADPEVVLDGRQRLHALAQFFRDELVCSGGRAPPHENVRRLDGMRFSDLPADVQRRVRRFRMTVVGLSCYEPAELAELLDRLHHSAGATVTVPAPRASEPPRPAPRTSGKHREPFSSEPIYDQLSAWFADLSAFRELSGGGSGPVEWSSPADSGQAAAHAAARLDDAGMTSAGLPQREPQAQLVPGAVAPPPDTLSTFDGDPGLPGTAHDMGERLANYRYGVAEGRKRPPPDPLGDLGHPMFDDGADDA